MKKFLIGADGGGSKTAFMLTDIKGNTVCETTLPRSNPNDIGIESTICLILSGYKTLLEKAGVCRNDIAAIYTGIAGVTAHDYKQRINYAIVAEYPKSVSEVNHDGVNILYAAFPDCDGVGVICGTGTSCFVKKGDLLHRIGGYGLFDLLGGGYEIGRAAISHALRSMDGRDEESLLSESVKKKAGFDLIEGLGTLISSGKNNIATYAPLVYDAYAHSDSYAREILLSHTGYLAELINTAGQFFDGIYEVSLAGGIAKDPITMEILKPMLTENARVTTLTVEPIYGALARAGIIYSQKKTM
ncbi:MAG: BadF/BadG/BcrA/BcrD ATPase family protein [Eubacteriales bacterium]|nr:BadF/BadG/BcrA/BcrD ATPase family protein [Eubacteriales bacterium]MDD4421691.1 BadF/BadG/BcrA/BcrD ATPase family protein [Eubacteriales bacterium]HBR30840.1 hypothetical protein [Clostridiales bacterium]